MNTIRNTLLAGLLAAASLPALAGAAEPAAAPDQATEQKLEEARKRLDAAAREVAELSGQMGRRVNMRIATLPGGPPGPPRSMLGVGIGLEKNDAGARVLEVSPGGPAAEAGIQVGDVITSVAGQDITKEASPGRGLIERMNGLEPDVKVHVGVLRDGKPLNLEVKPRVAPQGMTQLGRERALGFAPPPGRPGLADFPGPEMRQFVLERRDDGGTRFEGIEFATLSERLGGYFGVKTGVLVVRAGANSPWKLQDGDVILAIDGREPDSAQHAGRILRSYQAGEKLTLKVQRDRKAQNIEVTAPGGRDRRD